MSTDQTDHLADLTKDMAAEVEDLLGSGYVPDYYRSLASGFVGIAENYAKAALAARLAAVEREAKAAAWDEGFADGLRQDGEGADGPRYVNPYRA